LPILLFEVGGERLVINRGAFVVVTCVVLFVSCNGSCTVAVLVLSFKKELWLAMLRYYVCRKE
jgi:hypothetical protein